MWLADKAIARGLLGHKLIIGVFSAPRISFPGKRKGEGNAIIFESFQRTRGRNARRPQGSLKEATPAGKQCSKRQ
jgi:hypothetical protein